MSDLKTVLMLLFCPLRFVGGTGLRPVVSGVSPETVEGARNFRWTEYKSNQPLATKFGETPNLTGETPVPPAKIRRLQTAKEIY